MLLDRLGGYLVRPREHAAAVRVGEGRRDALVLGLLYAFATSLYPMVEAFATLWAVREANVLLPFAAEIGRVVLVPLLVLVATETILGSARSYQRAAALIPLVIVGALGHAARQLGWSVPGGPYAADIVGGVLGLGLVWWIRGAIEPIEKEESA